MVTPSGYPVAYLPWEEVSHLLMPVSVAVRTRHGSGGCESRNVTTPKDGPISHYESLWRSKKSHKGVPLSRIIVHPLHSINSTFPRVRPRPSKYIQPKFGFDHHVGHFRLPSMGGRIPKPPALQGLKCCHLGRRLLGWPTP